jgi:hypothetical protein
MTLKQAILTLPKLDKRWESRKNENGWWMVNTRNGDEWYCDEYITMDQLIAAARTIGYEIWWVLHLYNGKVVGYVSKWFLSENCQGGGLVYKSPALAIRAAFIAAVQDAKKRKEKP